MMNEERYTVSDVKNQLSSRTSAIVRRIAAAWRSQAGYSLIELIAAMTIFALISVIIVASVISVMQSSNKTNVERRTQQDARYSMEEIARQTRSASIDYAFYVQNAGDARCDFSPAGTNSTKALALIFTETDEASAPVTKRLVFFQDANSIYRYENGAGTPTPTCSGPDSIFDAPADATSGPNKSRITAANVTVPILTFFVSPNQDPYAETSCALSGNVSGCEVARNTHPRVTTVMTIQIAGQGTGVNQTSGTGITTLETTVGSRGYPSGTLLGQPAG